MIVSILVFLLVLSVLILVHELGHFIAAKRAGIWVEEFGFGLPPRLIGKKIGETIYSLNWLPFGGFNRLHGEQTEEGVTDPKRSFLGKSKKTRAAVIVAGVIMNFILALVCFAIVYSFTGIPRDTGKLSVIDVTASSPAQTAGIVVGDVITKVDNNSISSSDDFITKTGVLKGKNTTFEIQRTVNGKISTIKTSLIPRLNPPAGEGPIGVTITTMEIYFPPVWQRPFYGIYYGVIDSYNTTKAVFSGLSGAAQDVSHGQVPKGTTGPIGLFAILDYVFKQGILPTISFVGMISINLAVINILPFPALDGGRLLFIGIEAITKRKVPQKIEGMINTIGFMILLALIILISIGDVRRLITFKGITGFMTSLSK